MKDKIEKIAKEFDDKFPHYETELGEDKPPTRIADIKNFTIKKLEEMVDNFPSSVRTLREADLITGERHDTALGASIKSFILEKENQAIEEYKKELRDIIINLDSKYTGECCRKTANIYKEDLLNKLNQPKIK